MSGLAGKVRKVQESDEFDLGGYSKERCLEFAKAAFSEPFELPAMVKITFVCGGGKQCRQKYGDDLVKDFMSALDAVGFNADNAACCELSSGGTYKHQHDTSKNLIFVHVFPRVNVPEAEEAAEGGEEGAPAQGERDPADVLAECEIDDFRRMIGARVTSYSTRKRLLDALRERLTRLEEAERKLIAREQLDDKLQSLYDTLSADGLKEKVKVMAAEMQGAIDAGELTADERSQVMEQLDGKLAALDEQLSKAEADGKEKMVAKLGEQREKLVATKAAVSDAKPAGMAPIKYAAELQRLHRKDQALIRLEKESSGKFTLDELKRLGEKPEIQEAMDIYKTRSRMWFESDEEFDARLRHCLAQAAPKKKASSSSAGYSAAPSGGGGWSTVNKKR